MFGFFGILGTLLVNVANSLICFVLYCAFKGCKIIWWKLITFVVIISAYMTFTNTIFAEPYRTIGMMIIGLSLLSILLENKKIANFAILILSYIITLSILFVSFLAISIISYFVLPSLPLELRGILVVPLHLLVGLLLYNKVKYKSGLKILSQPEIQIISYILCFVYLIFHFYVNYMTGLEGISAFTKIDDNVFFILF